jgi:hypothetical protein
MNYLRLTLCGLLVAPSALCQANPICPWLNAATASGVLRDSATSPPATLSDLSATVCNFTYQSATASRAIRITVEQVEDAKQAISAYKAQCSAQAKPLLAVGNEAWMCFSDAKGNGNGERVVGRVRDKVFAVVVSTSAHDDPLLPREVLEEKTRNVAEAVAGSLF